MNHFIRILLTVSLAVAAVLIILFSTDHTGPRAQMGTFLAAMIRSAVGQEVEIEQYMEASMPRRLQRDMVKAWFRQSVPHSMTLPSALGQPISVISVTDLITYPAEPYGGYVKPLPYPPEDLWCVRLKTADPTVPKVLLLALHQDMYTAHWGVHEPADVDTVLAAVGCQFAVQ